jgi:anti-sigma B factor antagonist
MLLTCDLRTHKAQPGVAVLTLQGAIDPAAVPILQEAVKEAIDRKLRILVLDLGGIRYINSAGLGYLVNLSDLLADHRGLLLLANTQPKVKVVLDLMGVSLYFKQYKTVDSAFAAITAARRSRKVAVRQRA